MRRSYKMAVNVIVSKIEEEIHFAKKHRDNVEDRTAAIHSIMSLYDVLVELGEFDSSYEKTCECIDRIWKD